MKNYETYILQNFEHNILGDTIEVIIGKNIITIKNNKWSMKNFENFGHRRVFDLTQEENWSVLILFIQLLVNGYDSDQLFLEKTWKLGHKEKGSLDVLVMKNGHPFHMIEVKTPKEFMKYTSPDSDKRQLFTYVWQEKQLQSASYYTFDIIAEKNVFATIPDVRKINKNAYNQENFYEIWNKIWDESGFLLKNDPYNVEITPITLMDLKEPDRAVTKTVFKQFLTILRTNSVSDKSNAFDKIINIFIAKVTDERAEDVKYKIENKEIIGMKFQFIKDVDTSISLMKRLNDLYKVGMKQFLGKEIVDYSDKELKDIIGTNNNKILKAFEDLRLKKNSAFSFIEVFDDETFEENAMIVEQIVSLLAKIKFENNKNGQFLGDFFEELLNTTWKQEAGQFFTPMPIVDFIINSLPIEEQILDNIKNNKSEIIPKSIDYACGSGHFIISYMKKVQSIIEKHMESNSLSKHQKSVFKGWCENKFSWAGQTIFGIEKDYRLVKTTKISTFLNGDGTANIIHGDGINKFSANEYEGTILHSSKKTAIEEFDFVIGNPPYAVDGFEKNMYRNNITRKSDTFSLFENAKKGEIESIFVERTWQLLKDGGMAAIVLPRSVLSVGKYDEVRKYIFSKFKILSIFESGEITFSGTSTSPIILFLKKEKNAGKEYDLAIISSPKCGLGSTAEEREWLGYKFSSNKHKLGIDLINKNLEENIASELKLFLKNDLTEPTNIKIRKLSDLIIKTDKSKNSIYLSNIKLAGEKLIDVVDDFCPTDSISSEAKYIEISNLTQTGKISGNFKIKKSKKGKTAKKGDILFPKLVGKTNKFKIVIADADYYVTSAICVLRIKDETKRKYVFEYFKNNKNGIIEAMYSFGDGFKSSYLKIGDFNLRNNIKIKFIK